ncbi:MAG: hypothetical protein ACUVR2_09575 [Anaerolineae bacterium]
MAKKGKRSHRKGVQSRKPVAPTQQAGERRPMPVATHVTSKASAAPKVDLAQEYHYVLADLKKIGMIALAMFILLFALAFILR